MYTAKRPQSDREIPILRILLLCAIVALLLILLSRAVFATTYVITDGAKVFTYTTFATSPDDVLGEAGLRLNEKDYYTTQDLERTSAITICRAQNITLVYHGQEMTVYSSGETVGQLLERLEIVPGEGDIVSEDPGCSTYSGMILRVDWVCSREETYTATLPHETLRCMDEDLPRGREEVLLAGSDGELLRSALVTYVNGVEQKRTILREKVITPSVQALVAVGTKDVSGEGKDRPVIRDGVISLPTGEILTYTGTEQVRATAYTHTDEGCNMTTATGSTVHVGTVAVDPGFIPYGTRMFIVANDGSYVYGLCEAEDCGGAIKGDRVDLYFPTYEECMQFGWRTCTVYYLG